MSERTMRDNENDEDDRCECGGELIVGCDRCRDCQKRLEDYVSDEERTWSD